jgi:hypothetical protein
MLGVSVPRRCRGAGADTGVKGSLWVEDTIATSRKPRTKFMGVWRV